MIDIPAEILVILSRTKDFTKFQLQINFINFTTTSSKNGFHRYLLLLLLLLLRRHVLLVHLWPHLAC